MTQKPIIKTGTQFRCTACSNGSLIDTNPTKLLLEPNHLEKTHVDVRSIRSWTFDISRHITMLTFVKGTQGMVLASTTKKRLLINQICQSFGSENLP